MKQTSWALIMAAGKAEQISSDIETAFLYLNDRPVLAYSLAAFMQCPDISGIVVVVSRERAESVLGMVQLYGFSKVRKIVAGGAKRSASMAAGLEHIEDDVDFVCVHDASRPLLSPALVSETVHSAHRHGSGLAAVEIADPVVTAAKGVVLSRQDRDSRLWAVTSPQTYAREVPQARAGSQELWRRPGGRHGATRQASFGAGRGALAAHPFRCGSRAGPGADEMTCAARSRIRRKMRGENIPSE